MAKVSFTKPRVGISQCLLGEPVRYDGGHKQQPLLAELLSPQVEWLAFCPEVAAGLGVPRPPVRLVASSRGLRAQGVTCPSLDVTRALQAAANAFWQRPEAQSLAGFVLKSRSPSCGLGSTPVHDSAGKVQKQGDGFFAQAVRRQSRYRVVVEEEWLNSEARCYQFLTACWLAAGFTSVALANPLPNGLARALQQVLPDAYDAQAPEACIEPVLALHKPSQLSPLVHFWRKCRD